MRARWLLAAALLGLACGYGYARLQRPAAADIAAAPAPAATQPDKVETSTTVRLPRLGEAAAQTLSLRNLPHPPLPPARPSWSSAQDALRQRAEAGDAAAAREWLERDGRCYSMLQFGLNGYSGDLPTREFSRAASRGHPRLRTVDPQLQQALAIGDEAQRRQALGALQQRLLDECRGYAPQGPGVRYALGEIAARNGSDKDFWQFINDPPLAFGYSRDLDQMIDWARRAPLMVRERARGGDADAAYALGMAYAQGLEEGRADEANSSHYLSAAVSDDPLQAYRWLSLYLRNGDGDAARSAAARAQLERLGGQLSAEQRAQAQGWQP
ncbi:hypothetical protein [Tahibacter harae]|uniref:Sel1 repeat family protein n=1 Tax=Tahibacter harae TaxID=2963937 RepID=A0ABT1QZB6_9GAMM|nr:hypothetical protein [Tahibacter harae]MCQ4167636.1 hypothetical protein [Tahibacter harae]